MRTNLLFFFLIPVLSFSQIQIGNDIDGETNFDFSGYSVSLSSDGNIVAIGAPGNDANGLNSGHVRIYRNIQSVWTQIGSDIDGERDNDDSGISVSLSANGNIVAIGASGNDTDMPNAGVGGHVRVYENIDNNWIQVGEDINGESGGIRSGKSVSLSANGNILAVGATNNNGNMTPIGHVRVYENVGNSWILIGDIDRGVINSSEPIVSLSSDGLVLAIASPKYSFGGVGEVSKGIVQVYGYAGGGIWSQIGSDLAGEVAFDEFGSSVSLSSNGNILAISAPNNDGMTISTAGNVSIYENIGNDWSQIGSINGENAGDKSGYSISLSSNGNILAISAREYDGNVSGTGHVRLFENIGDEWIQKGNDIEGESIFNIGEGTGTSISLSSDGNILAIGSTNNNNANGSSSGNVRIYDFTAVLSTESFKFDYFSIYPNPAKDVLNITLKKGLELKEINIYNVSGQYLYSVNTSKIDVSNLTDGMYFVEVVTNKGKSAKKIIVE